MPLSLQQQQQPEHGEQQEEQHGEQGVNLHSERLSRQRDCREPRNFRTDTATARPMSRLY